MAQVEAGRKAAAGGLAPWQVELASRRLLRDPRAGLSVVELAGLCGLSRSYFAKAFKVSTGLPPHRWLIRHRIGRAREMLELTDERISLIAQICGFSDQSHLTRIFRAATGSSPAAWRRRRRSSAPAEPP